MMAYPPICMPRSLRLLACAWAMNVTNPIQMKPNARAAQMIERGVAPASRNAQRPIDPSASHSSPWHRARHRSTSPPSLPPRRSRGFYAIVLAGADSVVSDDLTSGHWATASPPGLMSVRALVPRLVPHVVPRLVPRVLRQPPGSYPRSARAPIRQIAAAPRVRRVRNTARCRPIEACCGGPDQEDRSKGAGNVV